MTRLLWLGLLGLVACSADVRRFTPANADLTQMAHLIALSDTPGVHLRRDGHYLFIWTVDGEASKNDWGLQALPNDLYLIPGDHRFTALYQHAGLTAKPRFALDLRAGMSYFVHYHPDGLGVKFWITEGGPDGPRVGRSLAPP